MRIAVAAAPLPPPSRSLVLPTSLPGLCRDAVRQHLTPLVCSGVLLADQVTKAVQPAGGFVVNTGAAGPLSSDLGDALWNSPTIGAACDTLDAVVLLVALAFAGTLRSTWNRMAATAVVAGLMSNLADRLGTSSLFHTDLPRGSIDWIQVPMWPTARSNVADVVIAVGALVLAFQVLRIAAPAVRHVARRTQRAHLASLAAAVLALVLWTHYWQYNREDVMPQPPAHSTTMENTLSVCPVDGAPGWAGAPVRRGWCG
jgi:lipoprotein signal peptidase